MVKTNPGQVKINLAKEKLQETMLTPTLSNLGGFIRDIELNREDT